MRYKFQHTTSDILFNSSFAQLKKLADQKTSVIITDENVFAAHERKFRGWNTIVLNAGEEYKIQPTVDTIIKELVGIEADRSWTIIGVGGGVVTDIAGFVSAIYMRGTRSGFVPTTLLSMVDACIGGKNGIDSGIYKNLVGTTRQPAFILYDTDFLTTLPLAEWENGFAEVIKHACIKDETMFRLLEKSDISLFQADKKLLKSLVAKNASIKLKIVLRDEFEKGERRLLNFGHTLGHALENQYELSHGQAISLGMNFACYASAKITGFEQTERITELLARYGLPVKASFDKTKAWRALKMDKKRKQKDINFVFLERLGKAVVKPISLSRLEKIFNNY